MIGNLVLKYARVQIDRQGRQIPGEDHSVYCIPHRDRRIEANIHMPLSTNFLDEALNKLETLASHNFLPCVYGLGAQAMLTNAPHIIRIFDTCAPVCLVGPSGRGKTLTMKMAQAMVGMQDVGLMKSAKRETVIALACKSTLGVWIDDPQQLHPELVVDFYNLSRQETLSRGSEEIRSGLMFTSNNFLKGTTKRENRRILYISYSGDPITPKNPTERQQQVALKKLIDGPLSATAGEIVRIGTEFQESGFLDVINKWEPFVLEATNGLTGDLGLHYAILHWFTRKPTTCMEEVMKAPPQLPLLDQFRKDIVDTVTSLPEEQLKNMFLIGSFVQNQNSVDAVLVHRDFYVGKPYTSKTVHACLKSSGEGLGKSQSRQWNGVSTPTTLVAQSSFHKDELIKIKTAMGNLKKTTKGPASTTANLLPTTDGSATAIDILPPTMTTTISSSDIPQPSTSTATSSGDIPPPSPTTAVYTSEIPPPTVSTSDSLPTTLTTTEAASTTSILLPTTTRTYSSASTPQTTTSLAITTVNTTPATSPLSFYSTSASAFPKTTSSCVSTLSPTRKSTMTKHQAPLPNSLLQRFCKQVTVPEPNTEIEEPAEKICIPATTSQKAPLWDAAADSYGRMLEAVGLIPVETYSRVSEEKDTCGRKRRLRVAKTTTGKSTKKSRGKKTEL